MPSPVGGDECGGFENPIGHTFLSGSRIFAGAACRWLGEGSAIAEPCRLRAGFRYDPWKKFNTMRQDIQGKRRKAAQA